MTSEEAISRSKMHLSRLEESFRDRATKWYEAMTSKKIPLLIYCSIRTPEEQEALYAQGRTLPGPKITNARGTPPQSLHLFGKAFDWVPLARTNSGFSCAWDDNVTYGIGQNIGEIYALRHLIWEQPHMEDGTVSGWRELAYGIKAEGLPQEEKLKKKSFVKKFFVKNSKNA